MGRSPRGDARGLLCAAREDLRRCHPASRVISFTGSTPVGHGIARQAADAPVIKRVDLELGGNSPFVVPAGADLERAVDAAIFGKFLHQGQIRDFLETVSRAEDKLRATADSARQRADDFRQEAGAKLEALREQAAKATPESARRDSRRSYELRHDAIRR